MVSTPRSATSYLSVFSMNFELPSHWWDMPVKTEVCLRLPHRVTCSALDTSRCTKNVHSCWRQPCVSRRSPPPRSAFTFSPGHPHVLTKTRVRRRLPAECLPWSEVSTRTPHRSLKRARIASHLWHRPFCSLLDEPALSKLLASRPVVPSTSDVVRDLHLGPYPAMPRDGYMLDESPIG